MARNHLLLLILSTSLLELALCHVYHITPSSNQSCPASPCLTLPEITSDKIGSNTTLVFLMGNHSLNSTLYLSNISTLKVFSSSTESVPIINCAGQSSFIIANISYVHIVGLTFRCSGNRVEAVNQFIFENSSFYSCGDCSGTILEIAGSNAQMVNSLFMFGTMGKLREHLDILEYLQRTFFRTILVFVNVGGAVIVSNSSLSIRSSHFEGNSAQIGGAIFSELNSNVTINNTTFSDNLATGCNDDRCLGGAVFVDSGCTVLVENSIIRDNMALSGGGAFATFQAVLLIQQSSFYNNGASFGGTIGAYLQSTLTAEDSQFWDNMAEVLGGVINVVNSTGFIENCTFNNNTANSGGGGVMNSQRGSRIGVDNCTFVNNSVGDNANGGVMHIQYDSTIIARNSLCTQNVAPFKGGVTFVQYSSTFTSENCTFFANVAKNDGGVIQVQGRSNASLGNSSFSNNRAGTFGGVIHVEQDSILLVDNCEFYGNSAVEDGGVIDIYTGGIVTIYNSLFSQNIGEDDAGVINSFGMVILSIYDSTFSNNSAVDDGGVMYVRQAYSVTIDGSTFIHNSAHQGGVVTVTAMFQNVTTTFTNCTLSHNTADFGGVIAALISGVVVINGSTFTHNTGNSEGGVAYLFQNGRMFVDNSSFTSNIAGTGGILAAFRDISITVATSIFENNSANNDGGAMYVFSNSAIVINSCVFSDNRADDGGVLYARQFSSIAIKRSSFSHNRATVGGAVRVRESSTVIVNDSQFTNNTAASEGGVGNVYRNSTITVNGSIFENNEGDYGGALVAFQGSSLKFFACSFINNTANFGGVARVHQSSNFIANGSSFVSNRGRDSGGIAFLQQGSNFNTDDCNFDFNEADYGGVIYAEQRSSVTTSNCFFNNNTAEDNGGVINAHVRTAITINNGYFSYNKADLNGGVVRLSENSTILIANSTFISNTAGRDGGALYGIESSSIAVQKSSFTLNSAADDGGVVYVQTNSSVSLARCDFNLSTARDNGGVIFMSDSSTSIIEDDNFTLNRAGDEGGALHGRQTCNITIDGSIFSNNTADDTGGAVHIEQGSVISMNNSVFSYNRAESEGGGMFALTRSTVNISNTSFIYNMASEKGGGLAVDNSSVMVDRVYTQTFMPQNTIVNNNLATIEGGGIYLLNSHFYFSGDTSIADNRATERGGGIHAVNSSIVVEREIRFVNNEAEYGGGISIEMNAKVYGLATETVPLLTFVANKAGYGGALHIADQTNLLLCSSPSSWLYSASSECFFQFSSPDTDAMFIQNINFSNNSAEISGSNLFGGLLDRCTIKDLTPVTNNGAAEFKALSGVTDLETVTSDPVRICFCRNGEPDCSYQLPVIEIKKGETIIIEMIAVDHVNHTINDTTIHASLNSTSGTLGEGQDSQRTRRGCTQLSFDLLSIQDSEQLLLYAEGPCGSRGISQLSAVIQILPCICPIGFSRSERDETRCVCDCDPELSSYITVCNSSEIIRRGNFWITYINSSGYLIFPNCPLDYCHSPSEAVAVNLNIPDGVDAQCVRHRSGTLCGTCKPGFSLSIGSSHCVKCSEYWPVVLAVILVVSIIAGIALVIFLLVLNLTVAVGTLNAIIFYANIVAANSSAFFLSSDITFASVFISWLNLDIGIDSCFFEGMDTYSKTWLQLAFPAYIIFIVTMMILFSSCSSRFSNLIGKRNPVATLATLLLFSYSKLLQTIISALSFGTLRSSNGRYLRRVWLPDATIQYLSGKHIPLFIVAIIIFLAGLAYTFLLFTWQWFLHSPRMKIFKWTRNQKLKFFMETYHAPYTPRHRYWTGLLLIARAILFFVSAVNFSGDPRVPLLSTIITMSLLFFYKTLFNVRIYKNRLISAMEMFTYFNIIFFATFTWYTFDTNRNQSAVAHTSVGIMFIMLLLVIVYHVYRYINIKPFKKLRQTAFCKKLSKKLLTKQVLEHSMNVAERSTQDLLEAIDLNIQEGATTYSVVDIMASQDHGYYQSTSVEATSNSSDNTEVTSMTVSKSTEIPKLQPKNQPNPLLAPLLDGGDERI